MNFIRSVLFGISMLGAASVTASVMANFDQDHMITTSYGIIVHSPFDTYEHITSYSQYGSFQWDISLNTKVLSMKLQDGLLYIFSASRASNKTYLTCVDPIDGNIIWERP